MHYWICIINFLSLVSSRIYSL